MTELTKIFGNVETVINDDKTCDSYNLFSDYDPLDAILKVREEDHTNIKDNVKINEHAYIIDKLDDNNEKFRISESSLKTYKVKKPCYIIDASRPSKTYPTCVETFVISYCENVNIDVRIPNHLEKRFKTLRKQENGENYNGRNSKILPNYISVKPEQHIVKVTMKRRYKCTIGNCNTSFSHEAFYKRHVELHKNDNLICCICQKAVLDKDALRLHHERVHSKIFPCISPECQAKFNCKTALKNHEINCHSPLTQPYPCKTCSKVYFRKETFKKHLLTHSVKVKTHACIECDKKFITMGELNNHNKSVHNPDRNFDCYICHEKFKKLSNLQRHENSVHMTKNYLCEFCNSYFNIRRTLIRHVRKCHNHRLMSAVVKGEKLIN